jgi:Protein of unknown function (DUF3568)
MVQFKSSGGTNMNTHKYRFIVCLFVLFLFSGCATALVVGGAAVGAGTGTYFFVNGELKTDYAASFDKVWSACEKTVADMRGTEVRPVKEIAQGKITTVINDEKVKLEITYRAKNQTSVAIRVGLVGNKLSSQLLHDKIADNLAKQ